MITIDSSKIINRQLADIDAKYDATFGRIRTALSIALLADGPGMDVRLSALRAEWQEASDAKSVEIATLVGG